MQEVEREKIDDKKEEMVIERYNKISVKPLELFSRNVADWPAQKVDARSSFRLNGLLDVLDNKVCAATHPARNTIVCYFLNQSVVKECVSSTFSKAKYISDSHVAWRQLIERYEESKQREPEDIIA